MITQDQRKTEPAYFLVKSLKKSIEENKSYESWKQSNESIGINKKDYEFWKGVFSKSK